MVFYKSDSRLVSWLLNVKAHLDSDYDYVLVVVGDTGVGKSMLVLHLLETWYGVILKEYVNENHVLQVCPDYQEWVENYKRLKELDMNIYDEASTALDSKDFMTQLSKDLSKLFNVMRSKRFFTVIVLPSYWGLNKYFRENRLRGLIWVDKRGHYKLYSKKGIGYLNAYNEHQNLKRMDFAIPIHQGSFPDYNGRLRELYKVRKDAGVDNTIDGVLARIKAGKMSNVGLFDAYGEDVERLKKKGLTRDAIAKELDLSAGSVSKILAAIRKK